MPTDAFTNSDGTALATHNASWTVSVGGFSVNTNSLYATGAAACLAFWNAASFNDDQYSQVVLVAVGGSNRYLGCAVRCDTGSADTAYTAQYRSGAAGFLSKRVAGTPTTLSSTLNTPNVNDVLRLEAEGTTITALVNAAQDEQVTDSAIASGAAGIYGQNTSTLHRLDDWDGGNLGAGVTGSPYYAYAQQ